MITSPTGMMQTIAIVVRGDMLIHSNRPISKKKSKLHSSTRTGIESVCFALICGSNVVTTCRHRMPSVFGSLDVYCDLNLSCCMCFTLAKNKMYKIEAPSLIVLCLYRPYRL